VRRALKNQFQIKIRLDDYRVEMASRRQLFLREALHRLRKEGTWVESRGGPRGAHGPFSGNVISGRQVGAIEPRKRSLLGPALHPWRLLPMDECEPRVTQLLAAAAAVVVVVVVVVVFVVFVHLHLIDLVVVLRWRFMNERRLVSCLLRVHVR
jgi:hypothetical protein